MGKFILKLLLLMNRKSKFLRKSCGGTDPVKKLNRMSKNDRSVTAKAATGKGPDNLLLLKSSS